MMQVRQDFVREAALLLADLAGRAGAAPHAEQDGFLKALFETTAVNGSMGQASATGSFLAQSQSAAFLAQLTGAPLPPVPFDQALAAYSQRLAFGTVFEGLDWPVDMHA